MRPPLDFLRPRRVREEVFFPGGQELPLRILYEAMDYLLVNQERVERAVYLKMTDLMNAEVDLLLDI